MALFTVEENKKGQDIWLYACFLPPCSLMYSGRKKSHATERKMKKRKIPKVDAVCVSPIIY